jgi:hypothetical protein
MFKFILADYEDDRKNWLVFAIGAVATAAGAFTVYHMFGIVQPDIEQKKWAGKMLTLWVLLPPIWFWLEYWLLFRRDKNCQTLEKLERFKFAVDLGKNVWLALVILLGALYFEIKVPGLLDTVPGDAVKNLVPQKSKRPVLNATDAIIEKPH